MTQRYATGDDWGTAGDWNPAAVPITDDEAFFGEDSPAMTGTMDQGGVDLDLLYLHRLFRYNLGASGAPLKIAADLLVMKGAGALYYECSAGGAGLKTDLARIACENKDTVVQLGSETGDAGDFDNIEILRGNVLCAANIAFGASCELQTGHMGNVVGDVALTIAEDADTLPVLTVRGGTVVSNGPVTLAKLYAGITTQDKAAMTAAHVYNGATLIYNHTAGTITVWPGGVLDISQTAEQKTLTIYRYEGSIVRPYDASLHTITETWY